MTPTATEERPTTTGATPAAFAALEERYERLPIDQIVPSKTNPRTHFDDGYLTELAGSIREKGLIQPILVRQMDAGSHKPMKFEIIAGECRYRASKRAGLSHIPSLIRLYSDQQVLELQLIENLHRKDLTALEQAAGYRALIKSNPDKHSAASIAQRIGMSEAWVWDRLKLNDLVPEAKTILEQELMAVGHAILIARLKPEDQKRVIDPGEGRNGYQHSREGLWQFDGGALDLDDAEPGAKRKPGKYDHLKPVSVRELESWIRDHIRFDVTHAAQAQPLVFEQALTRVSEAAAEPGRGKKVIAITHEYRVADDARDADERTYGSQSWQRADGQQKSKTCEHAVLGVVVAGTGYGDTFAVCVARDKCRVHFGEVIRQKEKTAKLRQEGKGKQAAKVEKKAAESSETKWKREQAERTARESAWRKIEALVVADAVEQVRTIKHLTAAHAAALVEQGGELGMQEIKKHLGADWFKNPAAALLVSAVTYFSFDTYRSKASGFESYLKEIAKPFRLDFKRLEAIRAKAEPGVQKAAKK